MIDHLEAALREVEAARASGLDGVDLAAVVSATQAVVRSAQALLLDATAAAHVAGTARSQGVASTRAWIAQTAGVSVRDAGRDVQLATELASVAPHTREAMSLPGMSIDKARIITGAMTKLPRQLGDAQRATVEADLVERAQKHSVDDLRRAAKRAVEVLDRQWADRLESAELTEEEARAYRHADFWMRPADSDGMVEGGFTLPQFEADILKSAMDALTAPRHHSDEATPDERPTTRQQLGRAFTHLIGRLPTDSFGNHGGIAATLVVTVDHDSLAGQIEQAGTTSFGSRIAPDTIRQAACTANILPAVLDGESQLLDLGRAKRLFTPAQRIALAHRDGGCAFPGCDRPPGWTEAHHMTPWSAGGATDLADGVLLCAHHHRVIHHTDWQVRRGRHGTPEFIPPASIDSRQRPRTNDRWRPLVA